MKTVLVHHRCSRIYTDFLIFSDILRSSVLDSYKSSFPVPSLADNKKYRLHAGMLTVSATCVNTHRRARESFDLFAVVH
jgi:hypothetical protein